MVSGGAARARSDRFQMLCSVDSGRPDFSNWRLAAYSRPACRESSGENPGPRIRGSPFFSGEVTPFENENQIGPNP